MSELILPDLQAAIYSALTADVTLMGMVSGVYDRVKEKTNFPYVTLGEFAAEDWSNFTAEGERSELVLRAYSREGGRKQVQSILNRLHVLLDDASLSISGHALIAIHYAGSRVTLAADGLTYQGEIRFTALTQRS